MKRKLYKEQEINNETMNDELMMKEKIDFFMHEKVKVHVKLQDKTFLNGVIEKELKPNVYWFIDLKLGGVYLFLKSIYDINKFTELEK